MIMEYHHEKLIHTVDCIIQVTRKPQVHWVSQCLVELTGNNNDYWSVYIAP